MLARGDAGRGKGEGAPPLPTRIARVVRRIVGAPDYDVYLEHCRQAGHPPRMTEAEYVKEFFESMRKGVRCC
jgi:uncharacterized short protein YbdD (DUF466 family)